MPSRLCPQEESYALLSHDDDNEPLHVEAEKEPRWYSASRSGRPSALTWALALLVVVAVTDGLALLCMSRIMDTVYADLGTDDLEFANPYYGLDALYRSSTVSPPTIAPIQNIPRVVAQVFPRRPHALAPVAEHDYFVKTFGTLSPHEKHLLVSPDTQTVAQFRALDFGMEECALVVRLPGGGDRVESSEPPQLHPRTQLDVFRLDAPRPLDVRTLSYRTTPARRERLATVVPRAGEETPVARFPCAWGSLHTFELACAEAAGEDCLVDVWSSQNTTYGIYMYQHQTI